MILLLAVAFGLTSATVILHALGTLGAIGHLARVWLQKGQQRERLAPEIQFVRTVSVLLLLHFVEAGIWVGLYRLFDLLPTWRRRSTSRSPATRRSVTAMSCCPPRGVCSGRSRQPSGY